MLICDVVDKGFWKPIKLGRNGFQISHLMFADDIILFGEASSENALAVKNILSLFCDLSGQSVSKEKSKILFSPNTSDLI